MKLSIEDQIKIATAIFTILGTGFGWMFKRISQDVRQIVIDNEVIKLRIADALKMTPEVKKNRENLIRLEEKFKHAILNHASQLEKLQANQISNH